MANAKITLVKSLIGAKPNQKATAAPSASRRSATSQFMPIMKFSAARLRLFLTL